ncbi:HAD family phosphatase, partial [Escherichia coli]|nr:HAD family phosphatase [Escherichia coli]
TTFRDELKQNHVQLQISVSNSSRFNAETMAYQTDKGTGIKEMIEHFGIHQDETLVIGDSDNDRAMFEFGHYTVAMKNARPEIQALTSDVTAYTNEEDGAAKYLAKHFLAD